MHSTRRLAVLVPASALVAVSALSLLAVLLGVAACGSPQPKREVATLRTPEATATVGAHPSGGTPPVARPRERLDMTPDESDALWTAYDRCLGDHGLKKKGSGAGSGGGGAVKAVPIDPRTEAKAEAACVARKPLPPWEYDTANPESLDFVHKLVRCLRAKGVRYVDEEPAEDGRNVISFGGRNNDSDSIRRGLDLTPACEKEVSVGGGRR